MSIPVALYSATHQYSVGDYLFSFLGIIGLATPNFLLALVLLVFSARVFGVTPTGLFSPEYHQRALELGEVRLDLLLHLPVPVIVVGLAGTAATIRILRSQLLDEFQKQYVVTARAKGVTERRLILKYPFRVALNPIISHHRPPAAVASSRAPPSSPSCSACPPSGRSCCAPSSPRTPIVAASCLMLLGVADGDRRRSCPTSS